MKRLFFFALYLSAASVYAQSDNMTDNSTQTASQGPCINVPVSISGGSREVTFTPSTMDNQTNVYIYAHKRRHTRDWATGEFADLPDTRTTKPILLRRDDMTKLLPQTYKVSVTSPQSEVTACQDSTLNINASISAEQESEFTGNYPTGSDKKNNYVLLSKHHYKKAERKLARVEKKERKVARATGVTVRGV